MKYLVFVIVLYSFVACQIPNPFDTVTDEVFPDTVVTINSLTPQICEVMVRETDSSAHLNIYWTDEQTGHIIYKMEDSPYKFSRLHGTQYRYDEDGDTLLIAHFDNGTRVDSTVYYWHNGNPKHKFFYSSKRDGNILFEAQFHENGRAKTDMIAYENGALNGAVDYYDDTEKREKTETYYYREGELIGIKIYNKLYAELNRRRDVLREQYRQDSARLAEVLLADGGQGVPNEVPVFYSGEVTDGMYDVGEIDDWDIMKIDPAFMLKYYNR